MVRVQFPSPACDDEWKRPQQQRGVPAMLPVRGQMPRHHRIKETLKPQRGSVNFIQTSSLNFCFQMKLTERLTGADAVLSGNFLILLITWILMNSTQPISDTFSSKYFVSLGATPFLLSTMFFLSSLAIAFVQFPGGYLADEHGRKWLVTRMTFGLTLCYLFFIFAPSWQWIVVGLVAQNLCLIYRPALLSMMLDSLHPSKRATGLNFYSVITGLIQIPAPLIAAALVMVGGNYVSPQSDFGMRIAYTIVFCAYLSASFIRLRLKETFEQGSRGASADSAGFPPVPAGCEGKLGCFAPSPQIRLLPRGDLGGNQQHNSRLPNLPGPVRHGNTENQWVTVRRRHGYSGAWSAAACFSGGFPDGCRWKKTLSAFGLCAVCSRDAAFRQGKLLHAFGLVFPARFSQHIGG